ncbi:hypothetical protein MY5147_002345 [Beauveria neobassiana]
MSAQTLVLRKNEFTQYSVTTPSSTASLLPGAVRVQPKLITLSLNNMGYAHLGSSHYRWWDAYPVSSTLASPPYDDVEQWGIVPAWGYGSVIESNNDNVPKGSLLYGIWPPSTAPVDLVLEELEPGLLREVSPHRQTMKPMYNRYLVHDTDTHEDMLAWYTGMWTTSQAGFLLGHYSFAVDPSKWCSPSLDEEQWPIENASLRDSVVVTLAASSKTAIGFDWSLRQRSREDGPLALVRVSNSSAVLPTDDAAFPIRSVNYNELIGPANMEFIAALKPTKVVIVDCGSGGEFVPKFHNAVLNLTKSTILHIYVGNFPTGLEDDNRRITRVSMDTGTIIERAGYKQGLGSVYQERDEAFKKWYDGNNRGKFEISWGQGIGGQNGVEETWRQLCSGTMPPGKAAVFKLD